MNGVAFAEADGVNPFDALLFGLAERMIGERRMHGLAALDRAPITQQAARTLREIAVRATERST